MVLRILACALASIGLLLPAFADPPQRPVQYVVISFDGAHDLRQWSRSRELARATGARFTYFLSCTFLLSRKTRRTYRPPGRGPGQSNVGFAASSKEVAGRLRHIWSARSEGHEIASHGCGHFDGKSWDRTDWVSEFDQFSNILRTAWKIHGLENEPAGWKSFAASEIKGFRAPYLSTGPALYSALSGSGFRYDASSVSRDVEPARTKHDLHRFSLPMIPEGPSGRRIIAMDYNLYVRHSAAIERPKSGHLFEARTHKAFRNAFDRQYRGNRIPLQFGYHFTLMNGGAYWRALERFAADVCGLKDVQCVSYRELLERLSSGHGNSAS